MQLAERLFQLRARDVVKEGVFKVDYLQDSSNKMYDLIEVNYLFNRQKRGFHLVPLFHYLFPNQIQRLIDEGGGYDHITSRRKKGY